MKQLTQKQKNNISLIILLIATLIIIGTIGYILLKNHKNKNIQTASIKKNQEQINTEEENDEEDDEVEVIILNLGQEIDITKLEKADEEENKEEETEKKEKTKEIISNKKYYIKVNNMKNTVTVYTKDEEGQYTVPVKAMICSTGNDTPQSGRYEIKGRWEWLALFGGVYGHYSTQIVGNILFHSVPYEEKWNPGSLEYWEYDKLGTNCSAGCVRLTIEDAKWIYYNVSSGTIVEFYSHPDPGPLGKPTASKISGNIECRNWDPTDPDENNPWTHPRTENNENNDEVEESYVAPEGEAYNEEPVEASATSENIIQNIINETNNSEINNTLETETNNNVDNSVNGQKENNGENNVP